MQGRHPDGICFIHSLSGDERCLYDTPLPEEGGGVQVGVSPGRYEQSTDLSAPC